MPLNETTPVSKGEKGLGGEGQGGWKDALGQLTGRCRPSGTATDCVFVLRPQLVLSVF